jgi:hypothetical protein
VYALLTRPHRAAQNAPTTYLQFLQFPL